MQSVENNLKEQAVLLAEVESEVLSALALPSDVRRFAQGRVGERMWHWFWTSEIENAASLIRRLRHLSEITRLTGHHGVLFESPVGGDQPQPGGPAANVLSRFTGLQPPSSFAITESLKTELERYELTNSISGLTSPMQAEISSTNRNWFVITNQKSEDNHLNTSGQFLGFPDACRDVIGRRELLEEIGVELDKNRWITLNGTVGVGKTTVAVEAARRWKAQSADRSAYYLNLRTVDTGLQEMATTLARGLQLEVNERLSDLMNSVVAKLNDFSPALIVFDNAEHVRAEVRNYSREILQKTDQTKILITSRTEIETDQTERIVVPPMEKREALSLLERTLQGGTDISRLTRRKLSDAYRIVKYAGFVPLAIELAASQARKSSITEVVDKINGGDIEKNASENGLSRVVDWSWRLLSKNEQNLLEQLSVFRAPFTKKDLLSVVSLQTTSRSEEDLVEALIEQSFVRRSDSDAEAFEVPNPVRRFAANQQNSEERSSLRIKFCKHFLEKAKRLRQKFLKGENQQRTLEEYESAIEHYKQAIHWSLEESPPRAAKTFLYVGLYFTCRGQVSAWDRLLRDILDALDEDTLQESHSTLEVKLRVWRARSYLENLVEIPDVEQELKYIESSLKDKDFALPAETKAKYRYLRASVEQDRSPKEALAHAEAGLKVVPEDNKRVKSDLLSAMGAAHNNLDVDSDSALTFKRKALDLAEKEGLERRKMARYRSVGNALHWSGDFASAASHYKHALDIAEHLQLPHWQIRLRMHYSDAKLSTGETKNIKEVLTRAFNLARTGGFQDIKPNLHAKFGRLHADTCNYEQSVEHLTRYLEAAEKRDTLEVPYYVALMYALRSFVREALAQTSLANKDFKKATRVKKKSRKEDFLGICFRFLDYGRQIRKATQTRRPIRELQAIREELIDEKESINHPRSETIRADIGRTVENFPEASVAKVSNRSERPREALVVAADLKWFEPPGSISRENISTSDNYRVLLQILLRNAPNSVPTRTLLEEVWPNSNPEQLKNRLSTTIHRVRSKNLNGVIEKTESGYRIDPDVQIIWV